MCKLLAYCEQCHTAEITTSARVCRHPDRSGKPCTSRPVLVSQDIFRRDGYTPQSQRNPLLCKVCRHHPQGRMPEPPRDSLVHHHPPHRSLTPIVESVNTQPHHSATRPQNSLSSKHPPFRGHPSISGYVSSRSSVQIQTSTGKLDPEVSYETRSPRDSQHRDISSSATAEPRYAVQNPWEIRSRDSSSNTVGYSLRLSPNASSSYPPIRPYPSAANTSRQTSYDYRTSAEQGPSRRPDTPINHPNILSRSSSVAPSLPTISRVGSPEIESQWSYPSRKEAWSPPPRTHTL